MTQSSAPLLFVHFSILYYWYGSFYILFQFQRKRGHFYFAIVNNFMMNSTSTLISKAIQLFHVDQFSVESHSLRPPSIISFFLYFYVISRYGVIVIVLINSFMSFYFILFFYQRKKESHYLLSPCYFFIACLQFNSMLCSICYKAPIYPCNSSFCMFSIFLKAATQPYSLCLGIKGT